MGARRKRRKRASVRLATCFENRQKANNQSSKIYIMLNKNTFCKNDFRHLHLHHTISRTGIPARRP
jgi:hypothetical protein